MNTLIAKITNVSFLAVAALPIIALGFAHAEPAAIKLSDLNMSRPADVRTLDARVDHAANKVCATGPEVRDLDRFDACLKAVRAEAMDKIPSSQAQARTVSPAVG
jgi:UrcA family protein